MLLCKHCGKDVPGTRYYDTGVACNLCGRILENFYYSEEVTFVKNAAGQSQASGNIVRSGISSSRERRLRIARDELMNLKDALGIGDEQDALVVAAANYFRMAIDQGFTKGRRSDLVLSSFLYLSCRQLKIPFLLIEFSSYLRVSVYELGSVYLKLCRDLELAENGKYEALVDPSIFIVRFADMLLKGAHDVGDKQKKEVVKTATYIIASMKRDWMQTGRKPSGICGAALYTAALSHGIKCSKSDIVKIVHICEATLTKRLIEFGNTEAASFTVDELSKTEKERAKEMEWRKRKPNSDKEGNMEEVKVVLCKHQDCEPVHYGLCASCYSEFIRISGGLEGGSDPPAFQRAEKQRAEEKASREENEEQVNSERDPYHSSVNKRCLEKGEGEKDKDESSTLSDVDDREVDCYFRNAEEARDFEIMWDLLNPEYNEKEAAKKAAAEEAAKNNCPGDARNLFEASKAAAAKARKEKRRKRAEEEKNAPPPATAMEAVGRMVERKKFSGLNLEALEELLGTCPADKKSRTETEIVTEKKKEEHEIVEDEEDW